MQAPDELTDTEKIAWDIWTDTWSTPSGLDTEEEALELFYVQYQGAFASLTEWAEDSAELDMLLDGIPHEVAMYFDTGQWAEAQEPNGAIYTERGSDHYLHVFDPWAGL